MSIRKDSIATCHDLHDATERPFVLGHFVDSGLMFLMLRRSNDKSLRIGPRLAGHMSYIFDHFSRHEQLPHCFPEIEYHI